MKKHTLLQRLLPLAMLAAMLLSAVPAAAAFRDTAGHWAEKTLDEWQDEGLIDGYGDGSFQPNGTVTRAEFIKLVNRTLGFTAESEISFSDVTERDWFHAEVAKAVTAGYAQGSGGLFRPNQPVTRAEAAAMLVRREQRARPDRHRRGGGPGRDGGPRHERGGRDAPLPRLRHAECDGERRGGYGRGGGALGAG